MDNVKCYFDNDETHKTVCGDNTYDAVRCSSVKQIDNLTEKEKADIIKAALSIYYNAKINLLK